MASRKKKIETFIDIHNDKDFHGALHHFKNLLVLTNLKSPNVHSAAHQAIHVDLDVALMLLGIKPAFVVQMGNPSCCCAEIYSGFVGPCIHLERLFTKIKIDLGDGDIVLLRVLADEVEALARLRDRSEPFWMFIVNKEVTNVFRGVNALKFQEVAQAELKLFREERDGAPCSRRKYRLDEATPDERAWLSARAAEKVQEKAEIEARHVARQAVRKKHRAELMTSHLEAYNFVMYWPHAINAHPALYERWDQNNLVMIAREEIQLTEEQAMDVLYAGDAPINEASIQTLLSGPALVICLKSLDPVHIVSLVRKILYEDDISESTGQKEKPGFHTSAYDHYKTRSPSREQVWKQRREEREKKKEEIKRSRARRLAELQRMAREARAEAIEAKKNNKEQKRMELLKSGKIQELEILNAEPDDFEDVGIEIPEALSDEEEEDEGEVIEDPNEYFPPPGLIIPGFYSPPNDIAKANGLALLFPSLVEAHVKPQEEFLPPHVLVMLNVIKRNQVIEHMAEFRNGILHMGIFKGSNPFKAFFIAYSVKQFEKMDYKEIWDDLRLCFMVSTKLDRTLLELMDFHPVHVSRDTTIGEDECAAIFVPSYGDDYDEFEDFNVQTEGKRKSWTRSRQSSILVP